MKLHGRNLEHEWNVEPLENNEFKFTAEKNGTHYTFVSEYFTSYIYTARENFLTLIE